MLTAIEPVVVNETAHGTELEIGTVMWAEALPTAALETSRVTVDPITLPRIQPLVTSVSNPGLVTASGFVPIQIIW